MPIEHLSGGMPGLSPLGLAGTAGGSLASCKCEATPHPILIHSKKGCVCLKLSLSQALHLKR